MINFAARASAFNRLLFGLTKSRGGVVPASLFYLLFLSTGKQGVFLILNKHKNESTY
jgi:hypothetical protein